MNEIAINGIVYRLVKKRTTCKDCKYFDFCDNHSENPHPNAPSWTHLCLAKNQYKFACTTACKKHFKNKGDN